MMKKLAVTVFLLAASATMLLTNGAVTTLAEGDDVAATYKSKCVACHGAQAEKAFDAAKDEAALVDAVLKGIKPKMPAYDQKLTGDQAKALVSYMRSLRN
jgi:mono/diheme cytochrome c family protein